MEKTYKGHFDEVIVNDDFENTYRTILEVCFVFFFLKHFFSIFSIFLTWRVSMENSVIVSRNYFQDGMN